MRDVLCVQAGFRPALHGPGGQIAVTNFRPTPVTQTSGSGASDTLPPLTFAPLISDSLRTRACSTAAFTTRSSMSLGLFLFPVTGRNPVPWGCLKVISEAWGRGVGEGGISALGTGCQAASRLSQWACHMALTAEIGAWVRSRWRCTLGHLALTQEDPPGSLNGHGAMEGREYDRFQSLLTH